jgi:hypothetical protein
MSILESIRDALASVLGGADPAEETPPDDAAASDTNDPPAPSDPTQLDPDAVTKTRTDATDDAVDALRSLRQPPADAPDHETGTNADESDEASEGTGASDDQNATGQDGTRRDPANSGVDDRDANH